MLLSLARSQPAPSVGVPRTSRKICRFPALARCHGRSPHPRPDVARGHRAGGGRRNVPPSGRSPHARNRAEPRSRACQPFELVLTLAMPVIDGRQVSEALARYRPEVALLCMCTDPDAVPHVALSDTPVRMLRHQPLHGTLYRLQPIRPFSYLATDGTPSRTIAGRCTGTSREMRR
jgi:hypothetical protein